jgi:hypothetical protein
MQENRLLSPKEIMKRFCITRGTMRKWILELNFPILVVSDKKRYVIESDLRAWEESMKIHIPLKNVD